MTKAIFLLAAFLCAVSLAFAGKQAVGVMGVLKCGSKFDVGTKMRLFDEDFGPDPDDLLDEGKTDKQGAFKLGGCTSEMTKIDPVFKIYTDCNDKLPCQRKIRLKIPDDYITKGSTVKKYYDIGELNLEAKFSGEERDCIH